MVELLFWFSPKTKNSRPQLYFQTKGKKKSAQKLYLLPFIYCFCPFFLIICTFLPNFFDPEALRGPSYFFKTLNEFGITPLAPYFEFIYKI